MQFSGYWTEVQHRLRVVENVFAIILFLIAVRKKEFTNIFVTLKSSRSPDRWKIDAWVIVCLVWTTTLGDLTRCHTSTFCMLLSIYMTFELNIKCLWQHPATINHLEIKEFEWSQVLDPIVFRANSLRQVLSGILKIPI